MQRQLSKHHQHKDGSDRTQQQQQEQENQEEEEELEEQDLKLCLHNLQPRQSSIWANTGEEAPAKEPVLAAIISVTRTKSSNQQ
ncbi:GM16384 [Drosophila sechellia]|uniref:GM16384 n=1 Tax=Drosophila sechellia TaxID=7238 RepID=B4IH14_DROSE|nr:GM16384 [Drosophila sechellia]